MHKVSLALAVLGSSMSLFAQNCNTAPPPATARTFNPWQASFYYGNTTGNTLNMFIDLSVQTPLTVNGIRTTTYDQGTGNPPVPNQVGNTAEVRLYTNFSSTGPTTHSGNEGSNAGWTHIASADMTIVAWNGDCPIGNFRDPVTNAPMTLTLPVGTYGFCIEYIPTTWTGTPNSATNVNPGSVHTIGYDPGTNYPVLLFQDQFVSIDYGSIQQNGWQTVDATGALVPNATPSGALTDQPNIAIDYTPDPTAGISIPFGNGCYDAPRMVYEQIPANTTPVDLADTSWTWIYTPSAAGGNYVIAAGGAPYDGTTAATGSNLLTQTYTSSSSASWDDASIVITLDTTYFPSGFPFPGGSCTDITVNSNGKIYLGNTTAGSFATNGSNYGGLGPFRDLLPQHSPFNTDLDPSAGGAIYFESPSPGGGVRITWHNVPNWPAVAGVVNDIQLELLPTGMVSWAFGGPTHSGTNGLACDGAGNDAIVGFSAGNGEVASTPVDFSGIVSYVTGDGSVAPVLSMASRPVIGTTADVVVDNLSPGTASPFGGFLSVGLAAQSPGLPLGSFGLAGCEAHLNLGAVVFSVILPNLGTGDLRWAWNVPASANGVQVFFQAGTLTPNPYNVAGVLVTNALCAKVGL